MRIVFMGTPEFAVPSLEILAEKGDVALVVTRPDAVRGRGRRLEPSPVKAAAGRLGLPVLEARRVSDEVLAAVADASADVVCVAAYGAILPDALLGMTRLGCVNVHASLLPRWRGAAPIQRAVLAGDERAGVSIMRIAHDLDAGAWCRQASTEVADKPCAELMAELASLGARELACALDEMDRGVAVWHGQDESLVTLAPKISKEEMRLDPADTALANKRRVQASLDAAPARLLVGGRGVRAMGAVLSPRAVATGAVEVDRGRVFLGCADGAVELTVVKPDGKREMPASAWAQGLKAESLAWSRA